MDIKRLAQKRTLRERINLTKVEHLKNIGSTKH